MRVVAASEPSALGEAMAVLDAGGLLVVPGDLGYHLVADALDDDAIARLFEALGRGADRPLAILVGGFEDVRHVAFGGGEAQQLALAHWPGPTALRLKPRPWLPDAVTAAQDEVDVLAPAHPFTRELVQHFGPLATALDQEPQGGALRVDAGPIERREAKVMRTSEPART